MKVNIDEMSLEQLEALAFRQAEMIDEENKKFDIIKSRIYGLRNKKTIEQKGEMEKKEEDGN